MLSSFYRRAISGLTFLLAVTLLSIQAAVDRMTGCPLPLGLGADIAITAANVLPSIYATKRTGTAGGTITAGQPLYKDAADSNKLKPADANLSLAAATVEGIANHGASAGQPISYTVEDPQFTFGGTGTVGDVLVLSATTGGVASVADLLAGMWPGVLGPVLTGGTKISLRIVNGSAAHA